MCLQSCTFSQTLASLTLKMQFLSKNSERPFLQHSKNNLTLTKWQILHLAMQSNGMRGKEKKRWVGNGEISLLEKNDIGTSIPFRGRMGTGKRKKSNRWAAKTRNSPFI